MSLRDDFQPKWKLFLKWGWLSFAVFILMAPVFYTMYISFNELGFGAKYYVFTFQWYENVFSDKQLINALGWTMLLALITLPIVIPFGLLSAKLYKQSTQNVWIVFVLLSPLFVPADILGSALLVFFKNLNKFFLNRFIFSPIKYAGNIPTSVKTENLPPIYFLCSTNLILFFFAKILNALF